MLSTLFDTAGPKTWDQIITMKHGPSSLLNCAVVNGSSECVEFLLKNKADRMATDEHQRTPLHLAVNSGHMEIIQALVGTQDQLVKNLTGKEYIEKLDANERTALHYAVELNRFEVVDLLIKAGADVNCKDKSGRRPLHICAQSGNVPIMHLLLKHETILVNCLDSKQISPLKLALSHNHYPCAKLLLEKGADTSGQLPPLQLNKGETLTDSRDGLIKFLDSKISKRGNMIKNAKTRYVVIETTVHKDVIVESKTKYKSSCSLRVYKNQSKCEANDKHSSIELQKYKLPIPTKDVLIFEPVGNHKPYRLKASSQEEAMEWHSVLSYYANRAGSQKNIIPPQQIEMLSLSMVALYSEAENELSIEPKRERRLEFAKAIPEFPIPIFSSSIPNHLALRPDLDSEELISISDYFAGRTVSTYPRHPETKVRQGFPICDR